MVNKLSQMIRDGVPALRRIASRFSGGVKADISVLFVQLGQAEKALKTASKELETRFLATSSDLELLKNSGDVFVKQVEKLISIATGRDCDTLVFSRSIELIERATSFLANCQDETDGILDSVRNYEDQIGRLLATEQDLVRAMMPLKCLQTLFKVESAPLGASFQQMFGALTEEMEGLHGQVREIFGTKFKQLEATRATLGQVISQLEEQSRLLRKVMTTHRAKIHESLAGLKKEMELNAQRNVSVRHLSRMLAQEVDQIVMGLQFQDIVNQKLEHVRQSVPKIQADFDAGRRARGGNRSECYQALRQSCRVEAGQVAAVQAELRGAQDSIRNGIQKVLSQANEVDSDCLSLREFNKLTTSCDGTVQTLLGIMEEVRALVNSTVSRSAETYEKLRPMGALTSNLTSNVRDLSHRIQLIGLNARLQAAQANEERPCAGLEVLSAKTNEVSNETNRISELAAGRLDDLAGGLARTVRALEKLHESGRTQQSILLDQGAAEEKQLHTIRDSALETLRDIGKSLEDIRKYAARALDGVDFDHFIESTLPDLHDPLAAIAERTESWLLTRHSSLDHLNRVDHLKRNYTMASEHSVFHAVINEDKTAAPVAEPSAPATLLPVLTAPEMAGGNSLGNNVELF